MLVKPMVIQYMEFVELFGKVAKFWSFLSRLRKI
jgi:hypothetical protein